jgi:hypothetical protein
MRLVVVDVEKMDGFVAVNGENHLRYASLGEALAALIGAPPTAEHHRRLHQMGALPRRRRRRAGDKWVLIDARSLTNHDAAENLYIATDPDATSPRHAASPEQSWLEIYAGDPWVRSPQTARLFPSPNLSRLRRVARVLTGEAEAEALVRGPLPASATARRERIERRCRRTF